MSDTKDTLEHLPEEKVETAFNEVKDHLEHQAKYNSNLQDNIEFHDQDEDVIEAKEIIYKNILEGMIQGYEEAKQENA